MENHTDISILTDNYEKTLNEILDNHAPIKERTITLRPSAAWYNDNIDIAKKHRRKLERRWRASRLNIDRQLYSEQSKIVNNMIKDSKTSYYSSIIAENSSNQKVLFNTVDKLLYRKSEKRYPTETMPIQLVNNFANFFHDKITTIRKELSDDASPANNLWSDERHCDTELTQFEIMNDSQVEHFLDKIKSCQLDPIPASILNKCKVTLLPIFTKIVNLSLQTAIMPTQLKTAMVKPKLKKAALDFEIYPNFRPISNLKFIAKVIERLLLVNWRII